MKYKSLIVLLLVVLLSSCSVFEVQKSATVETVDILQTTKITITYEPEPPSDADEVKILARSQGLGTDGVTMRVSVSRESVDFNKGVNFSKLTFDTLKELGVPWFNKEDAPIWRTKDYQPGTYVIKVDAWKNDGTTRMWTYDTYILK